MLDAESVLESIVSQRNSLAPLLEQHARNRIFTDRLDRICCVGGEAGIIQMALVDDCLTAIESVLFSLGGPRRIDHRGLFRFLKPVSPLFAKLNTGLYGLYSDLNAKECKSFLETHYTDSGVFGGANRRTKWSGFQLINNASNLSQAPKHRTSYKAMLEMVVHPLLSEGETIADVLELTGVWSALHRNAMTEHVDCTTCRHDRLVESENFRNPAILFDVTHAQGAPVVKLNTSHQAFSNERALDLILQAWAEMESTAWDRRKQMLEDIRSDWGRVARDLVSQRLAGEPG